MGDRNLLAVSLLIVMATFGSFLQTAISSDPPLQQKTEMKKPNPVDFHKEIQPIFAKHCYSCHGPKKQESGFRLDRKDDALNGGERGKSIVAGNSKKSLLYQYVAGLDPDIVMPPEDDTLSKSQVALIKRWIDEGADWPDKK